VGIVNENPSLGHVVLDLLERSVLVQSLLTLMLMGAIVYLWLTGKPVPTDLTQFTGIVLAYWMGSKVQNEANRASLNRHMTLEE